MKLIPCLSIAFDGQCETAFKLYEQCFDGSITFMMTWGESPAAADAPAGWDAKIYHATLKIGDTAINGGDPLPGQYERPRGFSVILQMDDPDAAERVFQALAENGSIGMPLQETFWAGRFGVVVDRFGISWTINCEKVVEAA